MTAPLQRPHILPLLDPASVQPDPSHPERSEGLARHAAVRVLAAEDLSGRFQLILVRNWPAGLAK